MRTTKGAFRGTTVARGKINGLSMALLRVMMVTRGNSHIGPLRPPLPKPAGFFKDYLPLHC